MSLVIYKKEAGITLIEVATALSIILVLLAVSLGLYAAFRPQHTVDQDARAVESVLRLARSNTLASKNLSSFGVHIESGHVVLFAGDAYDPAAADNKTTDIDTRTEIYATNLTGGGSDVVFNRLDGSTDEYGTISFRAKEDASQTATLTIGADGGVSTEAMGSVGEGNLARDARHVHFDLGWSIQNASTLEFNFIDQGTIESVSMDAFFNADKTNFDWSGSFTVGGDTQEFRVHTHSLDAFETDLSITRDRNGGKNTEKVEVRIIDGGDTRDIATYLADTQDIVQVGSFGGTMEIQ